MAPLVGLALQLAACVSAPPLPAESDGHPASPTAAAAPLPSRSAALRMPPAPVVPADAGRAPSMRGHR